MHVWDIQFTMGEKRINPVGIFVNWQTAFRVGGYNWVGHCFISFSVFLILFSYFFSSLALVRFDFTFSWLNKCFNLYGELKQQIHFVNMVHIRVLEIYANRLENLISFFRALFNLWSYLLCKGGGWAVFFCNCFCEFSLNIWLMWLLSNLMKFYMEMTEQNPSVFVFDVWSIFGSINAPHRPEYHGSSWKLISLHV